LMNEFGTTQIKHTIKEVCVKKNLNVLMCWIVYITYFSKTIFIFNFFI
jgi:hypothetical protein